MIYADGNEARIGDVVAIDTSLSRVVVASIDNAQYSKAGAKPEVTPNCTARPRPRGIRPEVTSSGIVPVSASVQLNDFSARNLSASRSTNVRVFADACRPSLCTIWMGRRAGSYPPSTTLS